MTTEIFAQICMGWLCCLQPMAALSVGIFVGRYGGLRSALGYLYRSITRGKE